MAHGTKGLYARISMLETDVFRLQSREREIVKENDTLRAELAERRVEQAKLAADLLKARNEVTNIQGQLQIATSDRVLSQRALAELVLRFCAK